jgi:hypothetical protein
VHAEHGGFSLRRRPGLPVCNRDESAADHAGLAAAECHRAAATPGLSRGNSLRSVRLPMECHARHRSNGACCPVSLDRSDSPQFAAPKNGSHRTTINNRMGPVDLAITRKPIQQHEVRQVPNSGMLANRVNAANKSFQNRNPIVSAASPRECHFGVRTGYLLGKLGRIHVVDHLAASALKLGEAVGLNSIAHWEQAQRP